MPSDVPPLVFWSSLTAVGAVSFVAGIAFHARFVEWSRGRLEPNQTPHNDQPSALPEKKPSPPSKTTTTTTAAAVPADSSSAVVTPTKQERKSQNPPKRPKPGPEGQSNKPATSKNQSRQKPDAKARKASSGQGDDSKPISSEEDDDEEEDGDEEDTTKLVLVVRQDLNMGKGKTAAQCGHATLGVYQEIVQSSNQQHKTWLKQWENQAQAKVVLKGNSENEMKSLESAAQNAGLPTHIVIDAGRTQIAAGSKTVLAIGPGPIDLIDGVTRHLKLL